MVSSFLFIFAGMEKIYNYYQDIVTAYTRRADNLKKKIHLSEASVCYWSPV